MQNERGFNRDMEMNNHIQSIVIVSAMLLGFALGMSYMATTKDEKWKKLTVEKGYAEYNQTTGIWQWKESKENK